MQFNILDFGAVKRGMAKNKIVNDGTLNFSNWLVK